MKIIWNDDNTVATILNDLNEKLMTVSGSDISEVDSDDTLFINIYKHSNLKWQCINTSCNEEPYFKISLKDNMIIIESLYCRVQMQQK